MAWRTRFPGWQKYWEGFRKAQELGLTEGRQNWSPLLFHIAATYLIFGYVLGVVIGTAGVIFLMVLGHVWPR